MRLRICGFLVLFVLLTTLVYAQEETASPNAAGTKTSQADKSGQPSAGMEVMKMGDANVMVAKGARVRKEGSLLITEDVGTYAARRFAEMEERFSKIEDQQNELKGQIERLTKAVEDLQKRLLTAASQMAGAAGTDSQSEQEK
jgi:hypothetical protein